MSEYETKRNNVISIFLGVCQVFAFTMTLGCLFMDMTYMVALSIINLFLWTLIKYLYSAKNERLASILFVFTTNLAVFDWTICFGFDLGWYMYFFTTAIAVHIFLNPENKSKIILALCTYVINFLALFYLMNIYAFQPLENLPDIWHKILFAFNIPLSFYMCYILARFFMQLDVIRVNEAALLLMKKTKLENEYKQLDLFNYIVSHNLKGPLGRIKGLAEILGYETAKTPNSTNVLHHIKESVEKMDEMISDLNMILSNRKKAEEAQTVCHLKEMIEEVKQGLEKEFTESKAAIRLELATNTIKGIKSVWHSILHNLISNAIKYKKADVAPEILIQLTRKGEDILIQISDNGLGIDLDKFSEKIFLLYNRFHTDVPGKGIGLFLVRNHVSLLGGDISILSQVGIGTTFIITIPAND